MSGENQTAASPDKAAEDNDRQIVHKAQIKNTSQKWLVVANARAILASCDSLSQARESLETLVPDIENSPWGTARVMCPGDNWETTLVGSRPLSPEETLAEEAAFAEAALGFPWLQAARDAGVKIE